MSRLALGRPSTEGLRPSNVGSITAESILMQGRGLDMPRIRAPIVEITDDEGNTAASLSVNQMSKQVTLSGQVVVQQLKVVERIVVGDSETAVGESSGIFETITLGTDTDSEVVLTYDPITGAASLPSGRLHIGAAQLAYNSLTSMTAFEGDVTSLAVPSSLMLRNSNGTTLLGITAPGSNTASFGGGTGITQVGGVDFAGGTSLTSREGKIVLQGGDFDLGTCRILQHGVEATFTEEFTGLLKGGMLALQVNNTVLDEEGSVTTAGATHSGNLEFVMDAATQTTLSLLSRDEATDEVPVHLLRMRTGALDMEGVAGQVLGLQLAADGGNTLSMTGMEEADLFGLLTLGASSSVLAQSVLQLGSATVSASSADELTVPATQTLGQAVLKGMGTNTLQVPDTLSIAGAALQLPASLNIGTISVTQAAGSLTLDTPVLEFGSITLQEMSIWNPHLTVPASVTALELPAALHPEAGSELALLGVQTLSLNSAQILDLGSDTLGLPSVLQLGSATVTADSAAALKLSADSLTLNDVSIVRSAEDTLQLPSSLSIGGTLLTGSDTGLTVSALSFAHSDTTLASTGVATLQTPATLSLAGGAELASSKSSTDYYLTVPKLVVDGVTLTQGDGTGDLSIGTETATGEATLSMGSAQIKSSKTDLILPAKLQLGEAGTLSMNAAGTTLSTGADTLSLGGTLLQRVDDTTLLLPNTLSSSAGASLSFDSALITTGATVQADGGFGIGTVITLEGLTSGASNVAELKVDTDSVSNGAPALRLTLGTASADVTVPSTGVLHAQSLSSTQLMLGKPVNTALGTLVQLGSSFTIAEATDGSRPLLRLGGDSSTDLQLTAGSLSFNGGQLGLGTASLGFAGTASTLFAVGTTGLQLVRGSESETDVYTFGAPSTSTHKLHVGTNMALLDLQGESVTLNGRPIQTISELGGTGGDVISGSETSLMHIAANTLSMTLGFTASESVSLETENHLSIEGTAGLNLSAGTHSVQVEGPGLHIKGTEIADLEFFYGAVSKGRLGFGTTETEDLTMESTKGAVLASASTTFGLYADGGASITGNSASTLTLEGKTIEVGSLTVSETDIFTGTDTTLSLQSAGGPLQLSSNLLVGYDAASSVTTLNLVDTTDTSLRLLSTGGTLQLGTNLQAADTVAVDASTSITTTALNLLAPESGVLALASTGGTLQLGKNLQASESIIGVDATTSLTATALDLLTTANGMLQLGAAGGMLQLGQNLRTEQSMSGTESITTFNFVKPESSVLAFAATGGELQFGRNLRAAESVVGMDVNTSITTTALDLLTPTNSVLALASSGGILQFGTNLQAAATVFGVDATTSITTTALDLIATDSSVLALASSGGTLQLGKNVQTSQSVSIVDVDGTMTSITTTTLSLMTTTNNVLALVPDGGALQLGADLTMTHDGFTETTLDVEAGHVLRLKGSSVTVNSLSVVTAGTVTELGIDGAGSTGLLSLQPHGGSVLLSGSARLKSNIGNQLSLPYGSSATDLSTVSFLQTATTGEVYTYTVPPPNPSTATATLTELRDMMTDTGSGGWMERAGDPYNTAEYTRTTYTKTAFIQYGAAWCHFWDFTEAVDSAMFVNAANSAAPITTFTDATGTEQTVQGPYLDIQVPVGMHTLQSYAVGSGGWELRYFLHAWKLLGQQHGSWTELHSVDAVWRDEWLQVSYENASSISFTQPAKTYTVNTAETYDAYRLQFTKAQVGKHPLGILNYVDLHMKGMGASLDVGLHTLTLQPSGGSLVLPSTMTLGSAQLSSAGADSLSVPTHLELGSVTLSGAAAGSLTVPQYLELGSITLSGAAANSLSVPQYLESGGNTGTLSLQPHGGTVHMSNVATVSTAPGQQSFALPLGSVTTDVSTVSFVQTGADGVYTYTVPPNNPSTKTGTFSELKNIASNPGTPFSVTLSHDSYNYSGYTQRVYTHSTIHYTLHSGGINLWNFTDVLDATMSVSQADPSSPVTSFTGLDSQLQTARGPYIDFQLPERRYLYEYVLQTGGSDLTHFVHAWRLLGYMDGTWTELHGEDAYWREYWLEETPVNADTISLTNTMVTFTVNAPREYEYYRLQFTKAQVYGSIHAAIVRSLDLHTKDVAAVLDAGTHALMLQPNGGNLVLPNDIAFNSAAVSNFTISSQLKLGSITLSGATADTLQAPSHLKLGSVTLSGDTAETLQVPSTLTAPSGGPLHFLSNGIHMALSSEVLEGAQYALPHGSTTTDVGTGSFSQIVADGTYTYSLSEAAELGNYQTIMEEPYSVEYRTTIQSDPATNADFTQTKYTGDNLHIYGFNKARVLWTGFTVPVDSTQYIYAADTSHPVTTFTDGNGIEQALRGPYIDVHVPEQRHLKQYRMSTGGNDLKYCFRSWKLLGFRDGSWTELHADSHWREDWHSVTGGDGVIHTSITQQLKTFTVNSQTPCDQFRLLITEAQTVGTASAAVLAWFDMTTAQVHMRASLDTAATHTLSLQPSGGTVHVMGAMKADAFAVSSIDAGGSDSTLTLQPTGGSVALPSTVTLGSATLSSAAANSLTVPSYLELGSITLSGAAAGSLSVPQYLESGGVGGTLSLQPRGGGVTFMDTAKLSVGAGQQAFALPFGSATTDLSTLSFAQTAENGDVYTYTVPPNNPSTITHTLGELKDVMTNTGALVYRGIGGDQYNHTGYTRTKYTQYVKMWHRPAWWNLWNFTEVLDANMHVSAAGASSPVTTFTDAAGVEQTVQGPYLDIYTPEGRLLQDYVLGSGGMDEHYYIHAWKLLGQKGGSWSELHSVDVWWRDQWLEEASIDASTVTLVQKLVTFSVQAAQAYDCYRLQFTKAQILGTTGVGILNHVDLRMADVVTSLDVGTHTLSLQPMGGSLALPSTATLGSATLSSAAANSLTVPQYLQSSDTLSLQASGGSLHLSSVTISCPHDTGLPVGSATTDLSTVSFAQTGTDGVYTYTVPPNNPSTVTNTLTELKGVMTMSGTQSVARADPYNHAGYTRTKYTQTVALHYFNGFWNMWNFTEVLDANMSVSAAGASSPVTSFTGVDGIEHDVQGPYLDIRIPERRVLSAYVLGSGGKNMAYYLHAWKLLGQRGGSWSEVHSVDAWWRDQWLVEGTVDASTATVTQQLQTFSVQAAQAYDVYRLQFTKAQVNGSNGVGILNYVDLLLKEGAHVDTGTQELILQPNGGTVHVAGAMKADTIAVSSLDAGGSGTTLTLQPNGGNVHVRGDMQVDNFAVSTIDAGGSDSTLTLQPTGGSLALPSTTTLGSAQLSSAAANSLSVPQYLQSSDTLSLQAGGGNVQLSAFATVSVGAGQQMVALPLGSTTTTLSTLSFEQTTAGGDIYIYTVPPPNPSTQTETLTELQTVMTYSGDLSLSANADPYDVTGYTQTVYTHSALHTYYRPSWGHLWDFTEVLNADQFLYAAGSASPVTTFTDAAGTTKTAQGPYLDIRTPERHYLQAYVLGSGGILAYFLHAWTLLGQKDGSWTELDSVDAMWRESWLTETPVDTNTLSLSHTLVTFTVNAAQAYDVYRLQFTKAQTDGGTSVGILNHVDLHMNAEAAHVDAGGRELILQPSGGTVHVAGTMKADTITVSSIDAGGSDTTLTLQPTGGSLALPSTATLGSAQLSSAAADSLTVPSYLELGSVTLSGAAANSLSVPSYLELGSITLSGAAANSLSVPQYLESGDSLSLQPSGGAVQLSSITTWSVGAGQQMVALPLGSTTATLSTLSFEQTGADGIYTYTVPPPNPSTETATLAEMQAVMTYSGDLSLSTSADPYNVAGYTQTVYTHSALHTYYRPSWGHMWEFTEPLNADQFLYAAGTASPVTTFTDAAGTTKTAQGPYLDIHTPEQRYVEAYVLGSGGILSYFLHAWTLLGQREDGSWAEVHSQDGMWRESWLAETPVDANTLSLSHTLVTFTVNATQAFDVYRLQFTKAQADGSVLVGILNHVDLRMKDRAAHVDAGGRELILQPSGGTVHVAGTMKADTIAVSSIDAGGAGSTLSLQPAGGSLTLPSTVTLGSAQLSSAAVDSLSVPSYLELGSVTLSGAAANSLSVPQYLASGDTLSLQPSGGTVQLSGAAVLSRGQAWTLPVGSTTSTLSELNTVTCVQTASDGVYTYTVSAPNPSTQTSTLTRLRQMLQDAGTMETSTRDSDVYNSPGYPDTYYTQTTITIEHRSAPLYMWDFGYGVNTMSFVGSAGTGYPTTTYTDTAGTEQTVRGPYLDIRTPHNYLLNEYVLSSGMGLEMANFPHAWALLGKTAFGDWVELDSRDNIWRSQWLEEHSVDATTASLSIRDLTFTVNATQTYAVYRLQISKAQVTPSSQEVSLAYVNLHMKDFAALLDAGTETLVLQPSGGPIHVAGVMKADNFAVSSIDAGGTDSTLTLQPTGGSLALPSTVTLGSAQLSSAAADSLSVPQYLELGSITLSGAAANSLSVPTYLELGSVTLSGAAANSLSVPQYLESGGAGGTLSLQPRGSSVHFMDTAKLSLLDFALPFGSATTDLSTVSFAQTGTDGVYTYTVPPNNPSTVTYTLTELKGVMTNTGTMVFRTRTTDIYNHAGYTRTKYTQSVVLEHRPAWWNMWNFTEVLDANMSVSAANVLSPVTTFTAVDGTLQTVYGPYLDIHTPQHRVLNAYVLGSGGWDVMYYLHAWKLLGQRGGSWSELHSVDAWWRDQWLVEGTVDASTATVTQQLQTFSVQAAQAYDVYRLQFTKAQTDGGASVGILNYVDLRMTDNITRLDTDHTLSLQPSGGPMQMSRLATMSLGTGQQVSALPFGSVTTDLSTLSFAQTAENGDVYTYTVPPNEPSTHTSTLAELKAVMTNTGGMGFRNAWGDPYLHAGYTRTKYTGTYNYLHYRPSWWNMWGFTEVLDANMSVSAAGANSPVTTFTGANNTQQTVQGPYLDIQAPRSTFLQEYVLGSGGNSIVYYLHAWKLFGYSGESWTELHSVDAWWRDQWLEENPHNSSVTSVTQILQTFTVNATQSYDLYRLQFTKAQVNGSTYVGILNHVDLRMKDEAFAMDMDRRALTLQPSGGVTSIGKGLTLSETVINSVFELPYGSTTTDLSAYTFIQTGTDGIYTYSTNNSVYTTQLKSIVSQAYEVETRSTLSSDPAVYYSYFVRYPASTITLIGFNKGEIPFSYETWGATHPDWAYAYAPNGDSPYTHFIDANGVPNGVHGPYIDVRLPEPRQLKHYRMSSGGSNLKHYLYSWVMLGLEGDTWREVDYQTGIRRHHWLRITGGDYNTYTTLTQNLLTFTVNSAFKSDAYRLILTGYRLMGGPYHPILNWFDITTANALKHTSIDANGLGATLSLQPSGGTLTVPTPQAAAAAALSAVNVNFFARWLPRVAAYTVTDNIASGVTATNIFVNPIPLDDIGYRVWTRVVLQPRKYFTGTYYTLAGNTVSAEAINPDPFATGNKGWAELLWTPNGGMTGLGGTYLARETFPFFHADAADTAKHVTDLGVARRTWQSGDVLGNPASTLSSLSSLSCIAQYYNWDGTTVATQDKFLAMAVTVYLQRNWDGVGIDAGFV